jgi:hypothetical protein
MLITPRRPQARFRVVRANGRNVAHMRQTSAPAAMRASRSIPQTATII